MLDLSKINLKLKEFPDEKSAIRLFRKDDPDEIERMWQIETDPLVKQFVEELCDTKDELLETIEAAFDYLPIAIVGKKGYVEDDEVDKLQGWVCVTIDDRNPEHLEVAFAKHSKAKNGQVASALRQVLDVLFSEHKNAGAKLVVKAYTNVDNEASRRVLTAAGFKDAGRAKYHPENETEDYVFVREV